MVALGHVVQVLPDGNPFRKRPNVCKSILGAKTQFLLGCKALCEACNYIYYALCACMLCPMMLWGVWYSRERRCIQSSYSRSLGAHYERCKVRECPRMSRSEGRHVYSPQAPCLFPHTCLKPGCSIFVDCTVWGTFRITHMLEPPA